jgi:hypothetical protein
MLEALLQEGCDFLYLIKTRAIGSQPSLENLRPEVVPMGIHAVFDWEPAKKQKRNAISSPMIVPHFVRQWKTGQFISDPGLSRTKDGH